MSTDSLSQMLDRFPAGSAEMRSLGREEPEQPVAAFLRYALAGYYTATDALAEWQKKFAADAAYAFEWGQDAMQWAAREKLYRTIVLFISDIPEAEWGDAQHVTKIRESIFHRAIRSAMFVHSSSSQISNLMEQQCDAVNIRFYEETKGQFDG